MATADRTAPAEARPIPSPSPSYEALRDQLLSLLARLQVVDQVLRQAPAPYGAAADVLHEAAEELDRWQENLETWYEDQVERQPQEAPEVRP